MQQPSLFTAGRTSRSRHASYKAGVRAAKTRGPKTVAYLQLLAKYPARGLSDHEAYPLLRRTVRVAFSSLQSIRANLLDARLITDSGQTAASPFGNQVTSWTLTKAGRAAVDAMK